MVREACWGAFLSTIRTVEPTTATATRCWVFGRNSTNPMASIWRSRWATSDASRANLHVGPHRSLRIQRNGRHRTALTFVPLRPDMTSIILLGHQMRAALSAHPSRRASVVAQRFPCDLRRNISWISTPLPGRGQQSSRSWGRWRRSGLFSASSGLPAICSRISENTGSVKRHIEIITLVV